MSEMESDHLPEAFSPPTTQGDTNLTQPKGSGEQPTSVDHINVRIGMLRQWLNEDRIKDGSRFVTNENIHHWLDDGIAEERRQAKIAALKGIPSIPPYLFQEKSYDSEGRHKGLNAALWIKKRLKQLEGENNE